MTFELFVKMPVIEHLSLDVDGSAGAIEVVPQKNYKRISRIIFHLEWLAAQIIFTNFMAGSALTNGLNLLYEGRELLNVPIKTITGFSEYAYDTRVTQDGSGTKVNQLVSRLSFTKFTNDQGLVIDSRRTFKFTVSDNLSGTAIHVVVEGWI